MPNAIQTRHIEPVFKTTHVLQGEYHVSKDPTEILSTVLGSCVATCLYDPIAGVGGMNHFLLPQSERAPSGDDGFRYGAQAMELLINALTKLGANKSRLEAKLFGGCQMDPGLGQIGNRNATFARQFLQTEGIPCVANSLGGHMARKLRFWPTTGLARQMLMPPIETVADKPPTREAPSTGDITWFEE